MLGHSRPGSADVAHEQNNLGTWARWQLGGAGDTHLSRLHPLMFDPAAMFANLAQGFSEQFGGPFVDGYVLSQTAPVMDDGGSIVTPGTPQNRPCKVQIDTATEAMRGADGFVDGDVRFIILSASVSGALDTDCRVQVLSGPSAGIWHVSGLERDPLALCWTGRGRKAS
jgi:hypothetical protein